MTVGIKLNDTNKGYDLYLRGGVLEYQKSFSSKIDVAIVIDTLSLKKLFPGITSLDDAIKDGQVKIIGGVINLKICNVFDTQLKEPGQATDADMG